MPEFVDANGCKRGRHGGEEEGADGGSVGGSDAARHCDAADDAGGDDVEFHARARRRADGVKAGGVEDAAESNERSVGDECREDALGDGDAVDGCGLAVGADRVEVAPGSGVALVERDDHDNDDRQEGEQREATDRRDTQVTEGLGAVTGEVLGGSCPPVQSSSEDVEGAQGDDHRRDFRLGDEEAVERSEQRPQHDAGDEDDADGQPRVGGEEETGGEGRAAEDGADGEVDAFGLDDEGLPGDYKKYQSSLNQFTADSDQH